MTSTAPLPPNPAPPTPTPTPTPTPDTPSIVIEGTLHKLGGTKARFLPSSASRKLTLWKPKHCQILSNGTFLYADSATSTTDTAPPPSSSSDEEQDIAFSSPLLPGGALPVSREDALDLADTLPASLTSSTLFTLRTRGPSTRTLTLAAPHGAEDARRWRDAANRAALDATRAFSHRAAERFNWLLAAWDEARKGEDGRVEEAAVADIAKAANFKGDPALVAAASGRVPKEVEGRIDYAECVQVMVELSTCQEVRDVYAAAAAAGGKDEEKEKDNQDLDVDQVASVLHVDRAEAARRMGSGRPSCNASMLQELLCAVENDACEPELLKVGNMSRPLSEYYMCSSHNTYLCGDQLTSNSTPAMYRMVLEAGGRCVEIDMWDGDEEPCVTHGHTATSKISLRSVLSVIAEYAFVASEYPVLLSLENHLCEEQQVMAAAMIREELGEKLEVVSLADDEPIPSPEALKGKVLVKAKMGQWGSHGAGAGSDEEDDDSDGSDDEDDDNGDEAAGIGEEAQACGEGKKKFSSMFASFRRKMSPKASSSKEKTEKKKTLVIAKELADVTSFGGANRKKLTALWASGRVHPDNQKASDIVSINESKVEALFEGGQKDILKQYNRRNMTRVYPKGSRVDSSNYNPTFAWASGCQIVALNYQSSDQPMWLNHGRFLVNGGSGYAPKLELGDAASLGSPIFGSGVLTLRILCGSLLPRASSSIRSFDVADPYVLVTITRAGEDGEPKDMEFQTETVKANGLAPSWGEKFTAHVANAELNMMLLCVWDEDTASKDDLIGFYSAPVYALRPGIRSMNLCKRDCTPLYVPGSSQMPTILVEIGWTPSASPPIDSAKGTAVHSYSSMGAAPSSR